jgi:hypothetical protein
MGKTLILLRDTEGNPIDDSITVQLTQTFSPFASFTGTLNPVGGNSNGFRMFTNLTAGDYNLKYNSVTQSDVSPLYIPGPPPVAVAQTIKELEIDYYHIRDGAIRKDHISSAAVGSIQLEDNAVNTNKLANNSVTSVKLVDASISKLKLNADVFSAKMEDLDDGWAPKLDLQTLGFKTTGHIELKDLGVTSAKLNDNAVTGPKLANNAVSNLKIADNAVTETKIADEAIKTVKIAVGAITTDRIGSAVITTEKLSTGAVTAEKLSTASVTAEKLGPGAVTKEKLATGAISLEKLDNQTRNAFTRPPRDVVYVSPTYTDNIGPYFDNIQQAVDFAIEQDYKTVLVNPGNYYQNVLINGSISLIGVDKTKCIINATPSAAKPYGIKISGAASEDLFLSNLSIYCISDNLAPTDAYGLTCDNTLDRNIHAKDLIIKTKGLNGSNPRNAIGLKIGASKITLDDCYVEAIGGNNTASGLGADGISILLESSTAQFSASRFKQLSKRGTGSTNGKGHSIKFTQVPAKFLIEHSTAESDNESIQSTVNITPVVINTSFNKPAASNVSTSSFVSVAIQAAVAVHNGFE